MRLELPKINLINKNYFSYSKQRIEQTQNNEIKNSYVSNPFALNKDTLELSFTSQHCSEKNFEIKNIPNLRCPACGLIMLTEAQINTFANEVSDKKGEDLVSVLEKYENENTITGKESKDKTGCGIYRPIKKQVVDVIKKLALEHPESNLSDLVRLQASKCIKELIVSQMLVVKEVEEYIKTNVENLDERQELLEKLDKYVEQIKGVSNETFARKKFIYNIKRSTSNIDNRNDIEAIASKMPTSETDVNSFFVKYANKAENSRDIAKKLVDQGIPTAEHMKPKSKGGKDRISNYICDCADCNSRRGNVDFDEWVRQTPEFEERLQEYVNDVQDLIDFDLLSPKYDDYAQVIINTIAELTEGEVVLEIPDTTNPSKIQNLMKKRKKEIEIMQIQHRELVDQRDSLSKEIAGVEAYKNFKFYDDYREIKEEIENIKKEIEDKEYLVTSLKTPLQSLKNELDSLLDCIELAPSEEAKKSLLDEYNQKFKNYNELSSHFEKHEATLDRLKQRQTKLRKQSRQYIQKIEKLDGRIVYLTEARSKIVKIEEKIENLRNIVSKSDELEERIKETEKEIERMNLQNQEISSNGKFSLSDMKKYNQFLHKNELLGVSDRLLESRAYKKTGYHVGLTREIIEIARDVIVREIDELQNQDDVIYFNNVSQIKKLDSKKKNDVEKYQEAQRASLQLKNLEEDLLKLSNGKTSQELEKEYKMCQEERDTITYILGITKKRQDLEHLTRIIKQNEQQLEKLKDFDKMSNSQYAQIVDYIELQTVFS